MVTARVKKVEEVELELGMVFKGGYSEDSHYIIASAGRDHRYVLVNMVTGRRFGDFGSMEDIAETLEEEDNPAFEYVGKVVELPKFER